MMGSLYPQHVGVLLFWLVSAVDGEPRLAHRQVEFMAESSTPNNGCILSVILHCSSISFQNSFQNNAKQCRQNN